MLQITPNYAKLTLITSKCIGEILGQFAFITVTQVFQNRTSQDLSLHYTFPMPKDASLLGFEIRTGEKTLASTVLEPASVAELNERAKQAGLPQDILVMERDTSYSVLVGMIKSGEALTVQTTFYQSIRRYLNKAHLRFPTFVDSKAADCSDCSMSIELEYSSFGFIEKVESPTHSLVTQLFETSALIQINEPDFTKDTYIIDIYEKDLDKPVVYQGQSYGLWHCTAPFKTKQRTPCEYLVLVDISDAMDVEIFEKVKTALKLCLKCLEKQDSFNIIAFENRCHYYSLKSLPYHSVDLESAFRWLDGRKPMGEAFITEAIRHAFDQIHENMAVLLITAGHIADQKAALQAAKEQKGREFYALCTDSFSNPSFLNELTKSCNGVVLHRQIGQEVEESVLSLFHKASSTGIEDLKISPDGTVVDLYPKAFRKVIEGESLFFMGKPPLQAPVTVRLNGLSQGQACEERISFSLRETGMDLERLFLKLRMQQLSEQITTEGNPIDILSKRELLNLSLQNNLITPHSFPGVALHIKDRQGNFTKIIVPAVLRQRSNEEKEPKNDICLLLLQQQEDGSFGDKSMHGTAKAVIAVFEQSSTVHLFRWQLKKSIQYLFDCIQKGEYDVLSNEVIRAFALWCEYFFEDDVFTKKIEAIVYMNRDLL